MFKICTILVLVQFLSTSGLPETDNNGGLGFQPRFKKGSQQVPFSNDQLHDHEFHENEEDLCSRRKNTNADEIYRLPATEFEMSQVLNPESPIDSSSTLNLPEVYFKYKNIHPDYNTEFDYQKELLKNNDASNISPQTAASLSNKQQNVPKSESTNDGDGKKDHAYNSESKQDKVEKKDVNNEQQKEISEKYRQNIAGPTEQRQREPEPAQDCPLSSQGTRRANNEENAITQEFSKTNKNNDSNDALTKQARKNYPLRRPYARYPYSPLPDPASQGVKALSPAGISLLEHSRVCYACTSANNPTCVKPDRRTTVKYCLKGHEACVTKTYQTGKDKDSLVLIRDCGMSCDDTEVPGYKYKSCKVCHSDVCNDDPFNGAYSIQGQSFIFTLFIMFVIKHTV